MDRERIDKFTGNDSITVVDAMSKIDVNSGGILFITDSKGKLAGCVTDGDIRRWLLKTGDLTATITKAMSSKPLYLSKKDAGRAEAVMVENTVTAMPIVDEEGRICDIIVLSDTEQVQKVKCHDNLKGIPVVVMAGGKGTRLYPYTKILPKPLIPIGDTPIIERVIDEYCKYEIDHFYMTVNYKKGMIRSYFSDLAPDYEITYIEENKPLGTGGSIKLIEEKFDRPLFVTNCDALIIADYGNIYDYHRKTGNAVTIVSALKNVTVPYGVLHSGEDGEVISMEEKPTLSYFINTGMYVINPEVIELIPDDEMFHMTQLVEKVMQKGDKVGMYPISEDSFLDMGELKEMRRMEEKLHIVTE